MALIQTIAESSFIFNVDIVLVILGLLCQFALAIGIVIFLCYIVFRILKL